MGSEDDYHKGMSADQLRRAVDVGRRMIAKKLNEAIERQDLDGITRACKAAWQINNLLRALTQPAWRKEKIIKQSKRAIRPSTYEGALVPPAPQTLLQEALVHLPNWQQKELREEFGLTDEGMRTEEGEAQ